MAHGAGVTVGQGDGAAVLGRLVDGFVDGNDDGAEESDGARLGAGVESASFRTSFSVESSRLHKRDRRVDADLPLDEWQLLLISGRASVAPPSPYR